MSHLTMFKIFLDYIFSIFMNEMNKSIKFTMNQSSPPNEAEEDRCQCEVQSSVPFFDILCSIQKGKIETDLYRKVPVTLHPALKTFLSHYVQGL